MFLGQGGDLGAQKTGSLSVEVTGVYSPVSIVLYEYHHSKDSPPINQSFIQYYTTLIIHRFNHANQVLYVLVPF